MTAVWNDRLISQERAYAIAGNWILQARMLDKIVLLECSECQLSIGDVRGVITLDTLVGMVLRHMVMQHDYSLKGQV